ncbi:MAG: glycosyltransferase family 2 protein [Myxococcota bacterium]
MSVDLIVSTYDRPGTLAATLQSIQQQTHRDWRALVVGDACDERTAAAVASLADARFTYVNLSRRFGEQAGPNSVGLALATAPLLAVVNHDDLWLPDHLERALLALARERADLFIARTAFVRDVEPGPGGRSEPSAHRFSRRQRHLDDVFAGPFNRFEPCSAWVFTRSLADRVGPWRPAATLYRSPLEDWLLRAWRVGARATFGRKVTVFKVAKRGRKGAVGPLYGDSGGRHGELARLLSEQPPATVRRGLSRQARSRRERRRRAPGSRSRVARRRAREQGRRLLYNGLLRSLCRSTGLDVYSVYCAIRGRGRGWRPRRASLRKTGRALPAPSDLQAMVDDVRSRLGDGPWDERAR